MNDGTRLNKYLASCAVGSRRACDALIQSGRVEVNGSSCSKLATRIQAGDHVKVDGRRVVPREVTIVAFHKPRGYVCSREDELGRDTIYTLLPGALHALHHVGRLDRDSEGLLILTNDGDLSQRLMHPSKSVEKEYLVTANQSFENVHLDQFLEGVYTEGGKLRAKAIERLSARRIKVVLDHGAKRQIRVMFETMGYTVSKLLRVRIGQLWLGDLEPGHWALLNAAEVAMLLEDAAATKKRATPPPHAPRRGDAPKERKSASGQDSRATRQSDPGILPGSRSKRGAAVVASMLRKKGGQLSRATRQSEPGVSPGSRSKRGAAVGAPTLRKKVGQDARATRQSGPGVLPGSRAKRSSAATAPATRKKAR
ncbi:MAG: pseudouridine synthase [Verrucomicrobia bacterium]|nr:MAG: pseudouridine synthase [Verrucomicrobiota bacterium]